MPLRPEPGAAPAAGGLCTWRITPANPAAARLRCAIDVAVGAFCRPPGISDRGVDAALAAGQRIGPTAMRSAEHPGPHPQALAHVVAGGFSDDAVWQSMRARFIPTLAIEKLPQSLLERFDGDAVTDRLTRALRWIAPLSTRMPIAQA